MSVSAFVWAMARARELRLPVGERMLLIALADRANGHCYCYPGQETLADDTGLSSRQVRTLAPTLEGHGLIRIEKRGRVLYYHILRGNSTAIPEVTSAIAGQTPEQASAIAPSKPEVTSGITPETISGNGRDTGSPGPEYRKPLPTNLREPRKKVSKEEPPLGPPQGGRRGRLLPPDWHPNEKSIALGIDLGLSRSEILLEADGMRDWARAKAQTGADWDARFNNWLRKEAKDRHLRRIRTERPSLAEEWGLKSFLTPNFDDDEPTTGRLLS